MSLQPYCRPFASPTPLGPLSCSRLKRRQLAEQGRLSREAALAAALAADTLDPSSALAGGGAGAAGVCGHWHMSGGLYLLQTVLVFWHEWAFFLVCVPSPPPSFSCVRCVFAALPASSNCGDHIPALPSFSLAPVPGTLCVFRWWQRGCCIGLRPSSSGRGSGPQLAGASGGGR